MIPIGLKKRKMMREISIRHHLTPNDQQQAVIPTPLWKLILEVEGWFPVKKEAHI